MRFDGVSAFTPGRTISQSHYFPPPNLEIPMPPNPTPGHFVFTALYELSLAQSQQLGLSVPAVLIFGTGQYRQSSLYLSYIPVSQFWSGVDSNGNSATRYFTGYQAGQSTQKIPTWSVFETQAVPVLWDTPPSGSPAYPDPGTIGNGSVTFDTQSNLWLITYDGGRQANSESTIGVYFTYAKSPWGPWQAPQLIYNACQAHSYGQGYGDILFYYSKNVGDPAENTCPAALPSGLPANKPGHSGPAGPIIGNGLDYFGQRGAIYDSPSATAIC